MSTRAFSALVVLLSASASAQTATNTAPQQSVSPSAEAVGGNPEPHIRQMVDSYRRSWERMGERQRKAIIQGGGYTPERYEQMIRQHLSAGAAAQAGQSFLQQEPAAPKPTAPVQRATEPDHARDVNLDALHTIRNSSEDLNAIRDGNLQRVQKDGCPPQISTRIADLKGRLVDYQSRLVGSVVVTAEAAEAPQSPPAKRPTGSAETLAADWFKVAPKSDANSTKTGVDRQLDSVLVGAEGRPVRAAAPPAGSAEAAKQSEETQAEIVRIQTELQRLVGACPAAR